MVSNTTRIWNDLENQKDLSQFLKEVFKSLNDEINLTIERFGFIQDSKNHLFAICNEMTWAGLFSNAIVRRFGEKAAVLREISLYNNGKLHGRPDILVNIDLNGTSYNLLFEAKMGFWNGGWSGSDEIKNEQLKVVYQNIQDQAINYGKLMSQYVKENYNAIIIPIKFEWMKSNKAIQEAKTYINNPQWDKQTEFCSLYTSGNYGVWAYGKVFMPE